MAKKKGDGKFNTEIAKKILVTVGTWTLGGAVGLGLAAICVVVPGVGYVIKGIADLIKEAKPRERYRIKNTFKELMRARLIEQKYLPDGRISMILSKNGKRKLLQYNFDELKISKPKKWDGKWRLVIFDLPKRYARERNVWRDKLRRLGFYQLQKSVWVHPFECENEVDFASEHLKISPHVRIVVAEKLGEIDELQEFFGLPHVAFTHRNHPIL